MAKLSLPKTSFLAGESFSSFTWPILDTNHKKNELLRLVWTNIFITGGYILQGGLPITKVQGLWHCRRQSSPETFPQAMAVQRNPKMLPLIGLLTNYRGIVTCGIQTHKKRPSEPELMSCPPFHIFRGQGSSTEELLPEDPQDQKWDDKLKKTW